jgi:hypothetical protein
MRLPPPVRAAEPAATAAPPTAAAVATAPSPATAPVAPAPGSTGRVVGAHTFMPTGVVPGALLTTSFASNFAFASGASRADLTIAGRTLDATVEYAGVGANMAFELAFLEHFSARLAIDEMVYSGTSGRSAVFVGATGQVNVNAGVSAGIPLGDSARIALLFDAGLGPSAGLTIASGIQGIVDACQSTSGCDPEAGSFFVMRVLRNYTPSVAVSWAPIPALGITADVGYVWVTEVTNGHEGEFSGQGGVVGVAFDYDFRAVSRVPIGLQAQFRWQAPTKGTVLQHVTDLGGGIFYTGRENLALGLQLVDRQFAITPDVKVSWSTWLGQLGLRYYW